MVAGYQCAGAAAEAATLAGVTKVLLADAPATAELEAAGFAVFDEPTEAIAIAAAAQPAPLNDDTFQDDHGIALGSRVTVAAQSFGTETTEGTLVAATRTHYTLARTDDRAGRLHVHFPRIGYVLKEVKA